MVATGEEIDTGKGASVISCGARTHQLAQLLGDAPAVAGHGEKSRVAPRAGPPPHGSSYRQAARRPTSSDTVAVGG